MVQVIAVVSLATSLVVLVTALVSLRLALVARKKAAQTEVEVKAAVQEVHVLVNSQLQTTLLRVYELHGLLKDHGVAVPPPSVPLPQMPSQAPPVG